MNIVSPEEVDSFRRRGFVVLPGLLSSDEVERFASLVDEAVLQRCGPAGWTVEGKDPYDQMFTQCTNLWEDFPALRALTFHQRIAGAAARLLGCAGVRLIEDQALYKCAGAPETGVHQDQSRIPLVESDAVISAWIPLQATDLDNGTMGYYAGSHRIGLVSLADFAFGRGRALYETEVAGQGAVFAPMSRGAVAFHGGWTLHTARPNSSRAVRKAFAVVYCRDGVRRGRDMGHPSFDRDGIAVGQPVAGPGTPLAFPLPGGEFPPAPAPLPSAPPGWPTR